jgi:alkylation response protein AidB-like acyl-CoA dehydrogenase
VQIYNPPIDDIKFILKTIGYEDLLKFDRFAPYDFETMNEMLDQIGKFCVNEMLTINRSGDEAGVHFDASKNEVTMAEGFKELYQKYTENGFMGLTQPEEHGGGDGPLILGVGLHEMVAATNKSFSLCPMLTNDAVLAILKHATPDLIQKFAPKMISGEWTGSMCLTEPQCGTDLGLLSTKATPKDDHYLLTGNKIWITFGEHDFTDNIIHLVLARLPDAPSGVKGISLFIVPKVNLDGSRNSIVCSGLEHKMGIHACPTCVMSMENAVGYLVGEPNKGMSCMFTMMNAARLAVGIEGLALSEIAYQTAIAFSKDRKQSRSLNPERRDKDSSADCILVHPDIRRMLLNIKSTNEGMRALAYWVAKSYDLTNVETDPQKLEDAQDVVALFTPIIKSYLSEQSFNNINEAMQVLGGSGYCKEWSIEQYMRDSRISMIYEGTNHIQALDLVGRKLGMNSGRALMKFSKLVESFIEENKGNESAKDFIEILMESFSFFMKATSKYSKMLQEDLENTSAIASNYLNVFALNACAYMWCLMAVEASKDPESDISKTKLKTARYYFYNVLPQTESLYKIIDQGKSNMMEHTEEEL